MTICVTTPPLLTNRHVDGEETGPARIPEALHKRGCAYAQGNGNCQKNVSWLLFSPSRKPAE